MSTLQAMSVTKIFFTLLLDGENRHVNFKIGQIDCYISLIKERKPAVTNNLFWGISFWGSNLRFVINCKSEKAMWAKIVAIQCKHKKLKGKIWGYTAC